MDKTIKIWNLESLQCTQTLIGTLEGVYTLALAASDQILSGAFDNNITLWDLSTGQSVLTLRGHEGAVSALIMCPELGTQCFASASNDSSIRFWDLRCKKNFRVIQDDDKTSAFRLHNNMLIAGGYSGPIKFWDLRSGNHIKTYSGHSFAVASVLISPTQDMLISGSCDNSIKIWDLSTDHCIKTLTEHSHFIRSLVVLSDGTIASSSHDLTIAVWSLYK